VPISYVLPGNKLHSKTTPKKGHGELKYFLQNLKNLSNQKSGDETGKLVGA
jgi:hypothetical protein